MRHVKTGGRVRAQGVAAEPAPLVVYTSTEGHSCLQKAVEILGLGHANLRRVPVDGEWRMDAVALTRQIASDRAAGLTPACVAATAGTVNTGAIDPLDELADISRARGSVVSRRRGIRRARGTAARAGAAVQGPGPRRQRRARPAQVDVCAGRVRLCHRARPRRDA